MKPRGNLEILKAVQFRNKQSTFKVSPFTPFALVSPHVDPCAGSAELYVPCALATQSVVHKPAALTSPGSLLDMHHFGTKDYCIRICILTRTPGDVYVL